jgi:hypothetical protein
LDENLSRPPELPFDTDGLQIGNHGRVAGRVEAVSSECAATRERADEIDQSLRKMHTAHAASSVVLPGQQAN